MAIMQQRCSFFEERNNSFHNYESILHHRNEYLNTRSNYAFFNMITFDANMLNDMNENRKIKFIKDKLTKYSRKHGRLIIWY